MDLSQVKGWGWSLFEWVQALASIATAGSIVFAGWQLRASKAQARIQFEDSLSSQYRELAARLPVRAFLGKELLEKELEDALPVFYEYFDLSNEQPF